MTILFTQVELLELNGESAKVLIQLHITWLITVDIGADKDEDLADYWPYQIVNEILHDLIKDCSIIVILTVHLLLLLLLFDKK